ncbi:MAG TPA: hypothetical protein VFP37_19250 [Steroidobacteraceae bacterium]|nr:hypothetical protein [Steroidobacteraceae bacterium]
MAPAAPPTAAADAPLAINQEAAGFCDARPESGTWLEGADFCDDFSDGVAANWESQGAIWQVIDNEYVGTGTAEACGTGFASNETFVRDLVAADVEVRFDMRSLERVDKAIVLRSTGPGDQIELNFRADPFNDVVVQELGACQFLFLQSFPAPHPMGQTVEAHVKLVGNRVVVWLDGELILDRSFPFRAKSGSVGLGVIEGGVTAFDNVQVLKNATCS